MEPVLLSSWIDHTCVNGFANTNEAQQVTIVFILFMLIRSFVHQWISNKT